MADVLAELVWLVCCEMSFEAGWVLGLGLGQGLGLGPGWGQGLGLLAWGRHGESHNHHPAGPKLPVDACIQLPPMDFHARRWELLHRGEGLLL